MAAATVTSKGQITIPASVREALGLKAGDRVEFVPEGKDGFVIRPATLPVSALRGADPKTGEGGLDRRDE
ncbi:MAG: AbrB/MazE/SpoVT family DNA-binding domain-containing protein [Rhizobiales bacterium]|nr:AbrB/MazE/SpoVT family DNA-binding domain-containing protein [Hyphomicrobiales bacterium]